MTDRVRHVDAVFGGARLRFALVERIVGEISSLELRLGGRKPYGLFQAFATGAWGMDDLLVVLSTALPPGSDPSVVTRVLVASPPGPYAILAGKILDAYLFGLAADEASFDEGVAPV